MNQRMAASQRARHSLLAQTWLECALFTLAAALVVTSAFGAKRGMFSPALAVVDEVSTAQANSLHDSAHNSDFSGDAQEMVVETIAASSTPVDLTPVAPAPFVETPEAPGATDVDGVITPEPGYERYYNGRPLRRSRTVWMTVTAYSPDHRSCGKWADGITASMKSVWTNGMKLVAADTRVLPMGSLLSVPGYDDGNVVPVLDRGGAIKGARLDVLYPTHAIARKWGVQKLPVTIWEYADED